MNKIRTLITIGLLAVSLGGLYGQAFRKTYLPNTSFCRDLVETPDGGFLMAGGITADTTLFLQKTNALGLVIWTHHLDLAGARAIAACPAPGGGYAVLTENFQGAGGFDNLVVRIDDDGNVLWTDTLHNDLLPNSFNQIARTSDGALAVLGETRDASWQQDFRLLKIDPAGAILWEKTFGFPQFDEIASRVIALPSGQLAVSGVRKTDDGTRDFCLARLDADGNLIWLNTYVKPAYQVAHDLVATADGGLLLYGETQQTDPSTLALLKTDAAGAEQWFRQHVPTANPFTTCVTRCLVSDIADQFYAPVYVGSPGSDTLFWFSFDAAGELLDRKALPFADLVWSVVRTGDFKFAYAGEENSAMRAVLAKLDENAAYPVNTLNGRLFWDRNDNCLPDPDENDMPPIFLVKAENQTADAFFKMVADPGGEFSLPVSEGMFSVTAYPLGVNAGSWTACDTPAVSVAGTNQSIDVPDIGLQNPYVCPALQLSVAGGLLRRCMPVQYQIYYCNYGNQTATGVTIDLATDTFLVFQSSSLTLAGQNGPVLTFELPDLAPGDCGYFSVNYSVSCFASLGQALCVEAHIFPDSSCAPPDPLWDGSHLEASAECDGEAKFTVRNTGNAMGGQVDYVIIEDQIIMMQGHILLAGGADTLFSIDNPDGHSYYLRAEQRPGHPDDGDAVAAVNSCGGTGGPNLLLQLPPGNGSPAEITECDEVVGSYDPNDKRGFPLGWQEAHYIEPGQEIDYLIRFQNTGTDTAFQVVIRDTLSELFAVESVRPGAASHPYSFDFEGNVLVFRFDNILLPDSNVNEIASHGFVQFRVLPRGDLSIGSVLENSAAIYFDVNEPVITNTYFHTLGRPLVSFVPDRPGNAPQLVLQAWPHPFAETTRLHVDGAGADERFLLTVFDLFGRPARRETFAGADVVFEKKGLPPGTYFYQLRGSSGKTAGGKILVH